MGTETLGAVTFELHGDLENCRVNSYVLAIRHCFIISIWRDVT